MKILTIADKKEEKFLRRKTADFDPLLLRKREKKGEIDSLIKQMKEMMLKANGVGLSANQIGIDLNFFVGQIPEIEGEKIISQKSYAVFNPAIIKISKKIAMIEEGCLSVPGVYGLVERPEKITLTGYDKNGRKIKIKAQGLLARVFQHEVDHLNGVLFIDRTKQIFKHGETNGK